MAQNVRINGVDYPGVPAVDLYKTGGGVARFSDTSDANAVADDILEGKTAYVNGVRLVGTGSGSVEPFAVIYAHYKPGAVCVCSDGVTTLTAGDTSGDYVFLLPNAGTWTVTATLDGLPSSYTVAITHRYQCEQVLLDRIYFIRGGVGLLTADEWILGWRGSSSPKTTLDENGSPYFQCNISYGRGSAQIAHRINFGLTPHYTTLHATYEKTESAGSNLKHVAVGYTDLISQGENDLINSRTDYLIASTDKSPSSSALNEVSLDVSAVTREHYIALWVGTVNVKVRDFWLE